MSDTADVLGDCLSGDVDDDLFVLIGERLADELWYSPGDIWLEGSELLTSSWTGCAEWIRESDPEFASIAEEPVREFYSEVADGIPPAQMLPRLSEILESERLVVVSVAADRWCRATHLAPDERATTKRLGSAPGDIGKANRMTPAGEVAFYDSITEATALAEIRATPPGYSTATAWWQPSRPLTLLDLTRIPAMPSFDVSRAMQRAALRFIDEFARTVSQPVTVSSDDPIECRATQAVCWYFQQHRPDVDGIVYASSLTGERSCALWVDNHHCLDESAPPTSELTLRRSPGSIGS